MRRMTLQPDGGRVAAVVLAAGKGTRMKSDLPKVLHRVCGETMIRRVVAAVRESVAGSVVVVTGHRADLVEKELAGTGVSFARQEKQLGTADAVGAARPALAGFSGTILVVCGDTPLLSCRTLAGLVAHHRKNQAAVTVLTFMPADPAGYGRIVRDGDGRIRAIVEDRDATAAEKRIRECNSGVYCVEAPFVWEAISAIGTDNAQGEFYFTDIVAVAVERDLRVEPFVCPDPAEVTGVNSPEELEEVRTALLRAGRCGEKIPESP